MSVFSYVKQYWDLVYFSSIYGMCPCLNFPSQKAAEDMLSTTEEFFPIMVFNSKMQVKKKKSYQKACLSADESPSSMAEVKGDQIIIPNQSMSHLECTWMFCTCHLSYRSP